MTDVIKMSDIETEEFAKADAITNSWQSLFAETEASLPHYEFEEDGIHKTLIDIYSSELDPRLTSLLERISILETFPFIISLDMSDRIRIYGFHEEQKRSYSSFNPKLKRSFPIPIHPLHLMSETPYSSLPQSLLLRHLDVIESIFTERETRIRQVLTCLVDMEEIPPFSPDLPLDYFNAIPIFYSSLINQYVRKGFITDDIHQHWIRFKSPDGKQKDAPRVAYTDDGRKIYLDKNEIALTGFYQRDGKIEEPDRHPKIHGLSLILSHLRNLGNHLLSLQSDYQSSLGHSFNTKWGACEIRSLAVQRNSELMRKFVLSGHLLINDILIPYSPSDVARCILRSRLLHDSVRQGLIDGFKSGDWIEETHRLRNLKGKFKKFALDKNLFHL